MPYATTPRSLIRPPVLRQSQVDPAEVPQFPKEFIQVLEHQQKLIVPVVRR
jgi:hypothetical protein